MKRFFLVPACFCLLVIFGCQPAEPAKPTQPQNTISGAILDEDHHPIAGAVVRVKATEKSVVTGTDGLFTLTGFEAGKSIKMTAWMPGYYIGGGEAILPGTRDVKIVLKKHTDADSPGYQWMSAFASAGKPGNCENCHADPQDLTASLPFTEWQKDAHALSAQNVRFLTMHTGTDVDGNQSPQTRYGYSQDYGNFPLRPNLAQPYYGPGYKLDFPNTTGNCAACHTPAASIDATYATDPTQVTGVGQEGITCDFCHKVWDVRLDPTSGLPFPNMPGVLSFEFRRPSEGHQFFAGPFDDVAPGEDTYTPIQTQSQFCAPCHFGSFWNTQIYNSFGEWLESPYSDTETGKTCQACHMPPGQNDHFALVDKGAEIRNPQTIFSHKMPGASDTELLQNAITVTVDAKIEGGQLIVEVKITNDKTGHHVPTDSPLRQMILLVTAKDGQGQALSLQDGPSIPEWGGVGDPENGYYGGLPGKAFAKVLQELWTEVTPTGAYWNPTRIVSDNRLGAFATDTSIYTFAAPSGDDVTVEVTLLFRRALQEFVDQKGWETRDVIMEQVMIRIPSP